MSDPTTSQTQQIRDNFRKAIADHAQRVEAAFSEMAKLEEKGLEQVCRQLDEAARLTKVSLAYGSELAAQWRKLVIDAARRTAEMIAPGGV
jgi:ABC-type phosphate transport system auxiliary subunit